MRTILILDEGDERRARRARTDTQPPPRNPDYCVAHNDALLRMVVDGICVFISVYCSSEYNK